MMTLDQIRAAVASAATAQAEIDSLLKTPGTFQLTINLGDGIEHMADVAAVLHQIGSDIAERGCHRWGDRVSIIVNDHKVGEWKVQL